MLFINEWIWSSNAIYSANLPFKMSIFLLTPFDTVTISVVSKKST